MDWIEEVENHEIGEDAAFTIIAEGPPPLTSRQQNKTKKSQTDPWQDATRDLTLQAYPKLYSKETEESRLQRASAFGSVWSSIESRVQNCLESTDAAVYDSLLALAKLHHPSNGLPATLPAYGLHRIPTGLVLAGGVNSADHVRTFPTLANHLRSEGCYVALLRPYDFGRSVSDALNAALRQLSGLTDTRADTFQALASWYADELTSSKPSSTAAAGGTAAAAGGGSTSRAAIANVAVNLTENQQPINNKERPLVIIVESTEAVLDTTLSDLVYVLSEGYPQLPITLVLGLNIAASAVPASLTDRALDCYSYNLATAVARLDTLVEKVLLSRWPGLLLDGDVVDVLWGHFMKYYFSPGIIVKGWKLAALAHFRGQPLAALAAVGSSSSSGAALNTKASGRKESIEETDGDGDVFIKNMKTAIAALPSFTAAEAKQQLAGGGASSSSSGRGGKDVESSITEFIWAWRRWALTLKTMVTAASTAGLTNGYTHWQLYESALSSNFSNSGTGKELLGRLERAVRKLDDDKALELIEKLSLLAKSIQNEDNTSGSGGDNEGIELEKELEALKAKINKNSNANTVEEQDTQEDNEAATGEEEDIEIENPTAATTTAAPTGKKRDRFFSKRSRKEALLSKAQATGNNGKKTSRGGGSSTSGREVEQPLGVILSSWLYPWLTKALRQPPTQLPAAKFFTCRDASSLDCLTAAPREAIHAALTKPQLYLPTLGSTHDADVAGPSTLAPTMQESNAHIRLGANSVSRNQDVSLGITADVEDACLAYQLFDQDPSCANVAEWFTAFRAVHLAADDVGDGDGEGKEKGQKGGKGKKGAAASTSNTANTKGGNNKKRKNAPVDPAVAAEKAEKDRLLAARFSQATAELQFIGLIKPLKKRSRGDAVQRAVHMPAPLMGDV